MKAKTLQSLSLSISALALLYLLFVNVNEGTFVIRDWLVVAFNLAVKAVVEIVLLTKKD